MQLMLILCLFVLILAEGLIQRRCDVIFKFTFASGRDCFTKEVSLAKVNVKGFVEEVSLGSQSVGPKDEARLSFDPLPPSLCQHYSSLPLS